MSVIKPAIQHPERIGYLLGANNYCWLHFLNGEKKLLAKPISYLESKLPVFIRVHKTVLINPACIKSLHKPTHRKKSGMVYLHTGEVFPVSRRRWPTVIEALQNCRTTDVSQVNILPLLHSPMIIDPKNTVTGAVFLVTDEKEKGEAVGQLLEQTWPAYHFFVTGQSSFLPDYLRQLAPHEYPTLLVLDARTTTMERFNTLQHIKQDKQLSRVPIIMLVLPADSLIVKGYQQQANSVVSMPAQCAQFAQILERICQFWLTIVSLPGTDR